MFKPGTSNEALSCPKCKAVAFKTIETRRNKYKAIRRRRECAECGYRLTTYEVSQAFYEEVIFFRKIAEQIMKRKFNPLAESPCGSCGYNLNGRCNFDFPEFDTEDAADCSFNTARS